MVHTFDNGLDSRTGLHCLITGKVADVAGTHCKHTLTEQGVLLIHHLLEHSGGVNARHVIVLKHRHERHRTSGNHQMVGIDVAHFLSDDVLKCYATTFEQVPHGVVEQDAVMIVAGESLRDVKTAHATKLLLFLKEEELMCLHIELAALGGVVVNHNVGYSKCGELLAASQSRRTTANDGNRSFVNLSLMGFTGFALGHVVLGNLANLLHAVNTRDADAAHLTVDKHFAGTTLADTALQTAVTTGSAVAVHNKSCLMKGGSYSFTLLPANGSPFKLKLHVLFFWKLKNRMIFNFIHDDWFIGYWFYVSNSAISLIVYKLILRIIGFRKRYKPHLRP